MKSLKTSLLTVFSTVALAAPAFAQEAMTLDQKVNEAFASATGPFVSLIFAPFPGTSFPWIVMWLVVAATVFTFYFAFVQFRFFGHAISLVKGDYSDPNDAGEVSHFQALATALSGTVGLGNIAGVAVAVGIGGPGATFWMILAGLLGMASKFTECTLGVKFRNEYEDGTVSGGPMYYISKGFSELGLPGGKILAVLFSIFCILGALGGGNMFQANQAHAQISGIVGAYPGWITGVIFAGVVFAVIVGGIKSIASVTEKVVPFMGILYVGAALIILLVNYDKIGGAFGQIFAGAFTGLGVAGGFVGALIQGFKRAAFSNEAGVGSAAIAHSAVKTKEPITEGFVSLLEPLIDTVVICTMTALVILTVSGNFAYTDANGVEQIAKHAWQTNMEGARITSEAFGAGIPGGSYIITFALMVFAFTTILGWSYYGERSISFLFGEKAVFPFRILWCVLVFCGAVLSVRAVWTLGDIGNALMTAPNLVAVLLLSGVVVSMTRGGEYHRKIQKHDDSAHAKGLHKVD